MRLKAPRLPASPQQSLNRFAPPPAPTVKPIATFTKIFTFFTESGPSKLLYSAEVWVRMQLVLEDAGPVAFGSDQDITPVLSGRGALLQTGVLREFYLSKGTRIFLAATATNRVSVIIEPLPPGFVHGFAVGGRP